MNLQVPVLGSLALSLCGHDKGKIYVIVQIQNPEFVYVADGTSRGIKNPKKKRFKHIKMLQEAVSADIIAKIAGGTVQDNEIHQQILNKKVL